MFRNTLKHLYYTTRHNASRKRFEEQGHPFVLYSTRNWIEVVDELHGDEVRARPAVGRTPPYAVHFGWWSNLKDTYDLLPASEIAVGLARYLLELRRKRAARMRERMQADTAAREGIRRAQQAIADLPVPGTTHFGETRRTSRRRSQPAASGPVGNTPLGFEHKGVSFRMEQCARGVLLSHVRRDRSDAPATVLMRYTPADASWSCPDLGINDLNAAGILDAVVNTVVSGDGHAPRATNAGRHLVASIDRMLADVRRKYGD